MVKGVSARHRLMGDLSALSDAELKGMRDRIVRNILVRGLTVPLGVFFVLLGVAFGVKAVASLIPALLVLGAGLLAGFVGAGICIVEQWPLYRVRKEIIARQRRTGPPGL